MQSGAYNYFGEGSMETFLDVVVRHVLIGLMFWNFPMKIGVYHFFGTD